MSSPGSWCPNYEAPEPRRPSPNFVACKNGPWKHLGLQRSLVGGMLRDWLTHRFTQGDRYARPLWKAVTWKNSPDTDILIEMNTRWRGDVVQKRPAVIIKRNPVRNFRILPGDVVGSDKQGNVNYQTMWVGSHTLFCIHADAGTEILADEVQIYLTEFAPQLLSEFGFHRVQVTDVGEISELEEAKDSSVIPITLAWSYEETWRLNLHALPLSTVEFTLEIE